VNKNKDIAIYRVGFTKYFDWLQKIQLRYPILGGYPKWNQK